MPNFRTWIPGLGNGAQRTISQTTDALGGRLSKLERKPGRVGIVSTNAAAKAGELLNIEAPTAGIAIVLPTPTPALRNARITLSFRNTNPVRLVCIDGTVNRAASVVNTSVGTFEAVCDGLDGWAVETGLSADGSPTDAEYVLGAAHASLPNGRVATDSTEIDAVLTVANVVSWALNTASVAFSKLQNLTALSVLGRAGSTNGVMAAITATGGSQHLVTNAAGDAIEWASQLSTSTDATVSGALGIVTLPVGVKTFDTLTYVVTGNTTLQGFQMSDGSEPPDGFALFVAMRHSTGAFTFTVIDDNTTLGGKVFRTPGPPGTGLAPDYVMASAEEAFLCVYARGTSNRWRIVGGTAAQAVSGDITIAAGNGSTRTAAITSNVIVDADVNTAAAIAQTKLGATTGFSVKASGASATTSAEPIVTYAASANMSAERVTTSSTSITVDIATANQVLFKRAALTGEVTATADSNATVVADGVIDPANLAVLTSSRGVGWDIVITFAAGGGGAADDVTIFNASAPFAFKITEIVPYITGGAAVGRTIQLRSAAGGAGAAQSDVHSAAATGRAPATVGTITALPAVALNGSVFLRRSDSAITGDLVIRCVRT